jgi:hypothetical protein
MNEKLEWEALWDAIKVNPTDWIPTTEAMYWEMLCAVPPRIQNRSAFLVGEPDNHNAEGYPVYTCFKRAGDSFYAKNMTFKQFNIEVAF